VAEREGSQSRKTTPPRAMARPPTPSPPHAPIVSSPARLLLLLLQPLYGLLLHPSSLLRAEMICGFAPTVGTRKGWIIFHARRSHPPPPSSSKLVAAATLHLDRTLFVYSTTRAWGSSNACGLVSQIPNNACGLVSQLPCG
jgi:hypothetical protein